MRNLTLEGKIVIFTTIMISKIAFQSFLTNVPKHIVNEIKKIQKAFFWNNSSSQVKHGTLCNDYETGGSKNVDITNKIIPLQCSWIKTLDDNSLDEWKLIPLYLIEKSFGTSFKFHSNLLFESNKATFFSFFLQGNYFELEKRLSMVTDIPSCALSRYMWYNRSI